MRVSPPDAQPGRYLIVGLPGTPAAIRAARRLEIAMETTYYIAQYKTSADRWEDNLEQQAFHADEAGIKDPTSEQAARVFAELLTIGPYAGRVRIIRRTDVIVDEDV